MFLFKPLRPGLNPTKWELVLRSKVGLVDTEDYQDAKLTGRQVRSVYPEMVPTREELLEVLRNGEPHRFDPNAATKESLDGPVSR